MRNLIGQALKNQKSSDHIVVQMLFPQRYSPLIRDFGHARVPGQSPVPN